MTKAKEVGKKLLEPAAQEVAQAPIAQTSSGPATGHDRSEVWNRLGIIPNKLAI